jgi:hypothetical protein
MPSGRMTMATDDDADIGGNDSADLVVLSDGSAGTLSPPPGPKIDLRDPHAVRRELAAVYRDARAGHLDASAATRLGYLLSLLLRAFETTNQQDRIEALERTIGERRQPHARGSNR